MLLYNRPSKIKAYEDIIDLLLEYVANPAA